METGPSPISLGLTEMSSDPSYHHTGFISGTTVTMASVGSSGPVASASHSCPREGSTKDSKDDEKQETT